MFLGKSVRSLLAIITFLMAFSPVYANATKAREIGANSQDVPLQILKTGVSLNTNSIAPNSLQLADAVGLTSVLKRIQYLRSMNSSDLSIRQDLFEAKQDAAFIIQKINLDIDFTIAAIMSEREVYQEILATFINERDKKVARINAVSFISNGILWTVSSALAIGSINTTYARNPKKVINMTIPSGIVGIAAGIVPSVASMYTLKAVNGAKKNSESEPNMLAKLFGYPTNPDIDYPPSVWKYLHQVPASEPKGKTRLEQIVDRWVSDSNMALFTDRNSKTELDVLTASVSQKKGLSIATLTARSVMLQQLHAEILKMKRNLLELNMVAQGEKQLDLQ